MGEVGDGWFGVNVTHDEAKAKIERIRQYAQAAGRDPGKLHFSVSSVPAEELIRTVDEVNDHQGLCTKSSCLWKLTSTLRVSSASLRSRYARCFRTSRKHGRSLRRVALLVERNSDHVD